MRIVRVLGLFFSLMIGLGQGFPASARLPKGKLIDLTYDFSRETIYWPTADPFELTKIADGLTEKGYYYAANNYRAAEHGGTHIDAPIHFASGRESVDEIPLSTLIGKGIVIDVTQQTAKDSDYQVSTTDFAGWERRYGRIPKRAIVLIRTGWGRFWPEKKRYLGTEQRGEQAVAQLHFPGLDPAAARWLVTKRVIKAVGVDTASIDYGQSTLFESHRTLFEKQIPAFENLAQLERLPVKGMTIIALPMKIKGGSGAPLRIVALVPGYASR